MTEVVGRLTDISHNITFRVTHNYHPFYKCTNRMFEGGLHGMKIIKRCWLQNDDD